MGLAGRKEKQRIGADPRNLTWADNAAKFGAQYLSKFGWDASSGSGLGVRGDGMTSHIKVVHKLDMMGIGAAASAKGKDGVAWKQAKDFELLLMRLNQSSGVDGQGEGVQEEQGEEGETVVEAEETVQPQLKAEKKTKKRKKDDDNVNVGGEATTKKKRKTDSVSESPESGPVDVYDSSSRSETKEERKARKAEKKRRKEEKAAAKAGGKDGQKKGKSKDRKEGRKSKERSPTLSESPSPTPEVMGGAASSASSSGASSPAVIHAPRPMAHRARFLASKRLALTNASAVSEILGVASSSSSTNTSTYPSTSATPVPPSGTVSPSNFGEGPTPKFGLGTGKLTPATDPAADGDGEVKMERLTMSTKSVAEYFKEKMAMKKASTGTTAEKTTDVEIANNSGSKAATDVEAPRVGIGHASREVELCTKGGAGEFDIPRFGLGSGSGLGFKGFSLAASSTSLSGTVADAVGETKRSNTSEENNKKKKEKSGKEDKKKKGRP